MSHYQHILDKFQAGKKQLAILIDPDKGFAPDLFEKLDEKRIDFIFVGGSLITQGDLHQCIKDIKEQTDIPVIIFPGNINQISPEADGILFLSLISGRNPELLIGNHVIAAPQIKKAKLEAIPTGYILVDGGQSTAVSYISNTQPIPLNQPEIAACTAMAGELLGLKMMYLEAGSGAIQPVNVNMIEKVKKSINIPLIVGGGIKNAQTASAAWKAGADMLVIGTAIEDDANALNKILETLSSAEA